MTRHPPVGGRYDSLLAFAVPQYRSSSPPPMSVGLNLAQQEAVNYVQGPCLVLAGAGSGKTRVITHKIGQLIRVGLEPQRIAAITFTNKAAAEMRERAKGLIGRAAKQVMICTFHALGVRMLRQDGEALIPDDDCGGRRASRLVRRARRDDRRDGVDRCDWRSVNYGLEGWRAGCRSCRLSTLT